MIHLKAIFFTLLFFFGCALLIWVMTLQYIGVIVSCIFIIGISYSAIYYHLKRNQDNNSKDNTLQWKNQLENHYKSKFDYEKTDN